MKPVTTTIILIRQLYWAGMSHMLLRPCCQGLEWLIILPSSLTATSPLAAYAVLDHHTWKNYQYWRTVFSKPSKTLRGLHADSKCLGGAGEPVDPVTSLWRKSHLKLMFKTSLWRWKIEHQALVLWFKLFKASFIYFYFFKNIWCPEVFNQPNYVFSDILYLYTNFAQGHCSKKIWFNLQSFIFGSMVQELPTFLLAHKALGWESNIKTPSATASIRNTFYYV